MDSIVFSARLCESVDPPLDDLEASAVLCHLSVQILVGRSNAGDIWLSLTMAYEWIFTKRSSSQSPILRGSR